ncbi:unnamed protein product [Prorocentrum cordatum]|uniref:Uncharacterized protein n=1 Tax=Prorocentrum cordatum TaxID=2364126 RepID=A0ABN9T8G0_9DINO|nr:unnamed protein product [Polarella glacialis]
MVHASAELHELFAQAANAAPCAIDTPWNITIGFDECTTGGKKKLSNRGKTMVTSFNCMEVGPAALCHEMTWMTFALCRAHIIGSVDIARGDAAQFRPMDKASEYISLYVLMRHYVERNLACDARIRLQRESFEAACEVVDLCMTAKRSPGPVFQHAAASLRGALRRLSDQMKAAYGRGKVLSKHHACFYIPDQFLTDRCAVDLFAVERSNLRVKEVADHVDNTHTWERSASASLFTKQFNALQDGSCHFSNGLVGKCTSPREYQNVSLTKAARSDGKEFHVHDIMISAGVVGRVAACAFDASDLRLVVQVIEPIGPMIKSSNRHRLARRLGAAFVADPRECRLAPIRGLVLQWRNHTLEVKPANLFGATVRKNCIPFSKEYNSEAQCGRRRTAFHKIELPFWRQETERFQWPAVVHPHLEIPFALELVECLSMMVVAGLRLVPWSAGHWRNQSWDMEHIWWSDCESPNIDAPTDTVDVFADLYGDVKHRLLPILSPEGPMTMRIQRYGRYWIPPEHGFWFAPRAFANSTEPIASEPAEPVNNEGAAAGGPEKEACARAPLAAARARKGALKPHPCHEGGVLDADPGRGYLDHRGGAARCMAASARRCGQPSLEALSLPQPGGPEAASSPGGAAWAAAAAPAAWPRPRPPPGAGRTRARTSFFFNFFGSGREPLPIVDGYPPTLPPVYKTVGKANMYELIVEQKHRLENQNPEPQPGMRAM